PAARRPRRRLATIVVAALLVAGGPGTVLGQAESPPPAEDVERAGELFGQGASAFAEGEYLTAADFFVQAYAYDPNPRLAFNAGRAFDLGGDHAQAARWYEQALATTDDPELTTVASEALATAQAAAAA